LILVNDRAAVRRETGSKEDAMIPTKHDYYKRRAREHRRLASSAADADERMMHDRLVEAYTALARKYRLRQIIRLSPACLHRAEAA
jgi:hypothetical protein